MVSGQGYEEPKEEISETYDPHRPDHIVYLEIEWEKGSAFRSEGADRQSVRIDRMAGSLQIISYFGGNERISVELSGCDQKWLESFFLHVEGMQWHADFSPDYPGYFLDLDDMRLPEWRDDEWNAYIRYSSGETLDTCGNVNSPSGSGELKKLVREFLEINGIDMEIYMLTGREKKR